MSSGVAHAFEETERDPTNTTLQATIACCHTAGSTLRSQNSSIMRISVREGRSRSTAVPNTLLFAEASQTHMPESPLTTHANTGTDIETQASPVPWPTHKVLPCTF